MTSTKQENLDWHLNFQDEDYLRLSIRRLEDDSPPLDWCMQFADTIRKRLFPWEGRLSLHDIGCNVGHFCRVLNGLGGDVEYLGYDISETYLAIARTKYPANKFNSLNVEKNKPSSLGDVSIVSATLEHIDDWSSALHHVLSTTSRLVLLRSFFGSEVQCDHYKKSGANQSYMIRQFTFQEVAELAAGLGFSTQFIRDRATDSVPQYLGCGIIRTQYVAVIAKDGS
jgi:hypothetical protein